MFDPWCPTCERRVLLGTRRIVRLHRDETDRLRLDLRCFCGTVVGSASSASSAETPRVETPEIETPEIETSVAPAGPDASRPRPAEGAPLSPAAAGRLATEAVSDAA